MLGREKPILYIGHGVGGLIMQMAAALLGPELPEIETGYIFLNTIFPHIEESRSDSKSKRPKYGAFPSNQRARRYGLLARATASGGSFLDGGIWQRFVQKVAGDVEHLSVAWFYRTCEVWTFPLSGYHYVLRVLKKPSTATHPDQMFFPLVGPSSSRFPGPHDPDYQSIIAKVKSLVVLHASKYEPFIELLKSTAETTDLPGDIRDSQGRSALHLASFCQNLAAVKFLVEQARSGRMVFAHKDLKGWSPLHVAVRAAAMLPAQANHDTFEEIIELLVCGTSKHSQCDNSGRTPWDYVKPKRDDHAWLKALRHKYRWVDNIVLKPFGSPNPIQVPVCIKSGAIIANFHPILEIQKVNCNYGLKSVHELLYVTGPHRILRPTRPRGVSNVAFRWIHFPANNVRAL
jgi:hypothetical protein